MIARERLIVALDLPTAARALMVARRLAGLVRLVKVGSVLFTQGGPELLAQLRAMGFQIMLDLKFYDIPSTVEASCRAAARHRVALLTVHASGGRAMLEAAVRGSRDEARRRRTAAPRVLGVTVLTSEPRKGRHVDRRVASLAMEAVRAGCDGVVASAQEARALRRRLGRRPLLVCPGIRPSGAAVGDPSTRVARSGSSRATSRDDQQRVATPTNALQQGADYLVVGRPITAARDPRAAAQRIVQEMEVAAAC